MKTIKTEIIIESSPARVWRVLTEFASYPLWNPFIIKIGGEMKAGERFTFTAQMPEGKPMTFKPVFLAVHADKELRWRGSLPIPGLFAGEHYFLLEDAGAGKTRLTHGEKFTGLLPPFMGGLLKKTEEGFGYMNRALKSRCEESA